MLIASGLLLLAPGAHRAFAPEARWEALTRSMAAPWPGIQRADGFLPDYVDLLPGALGRHIGTRYGEAMMGYALIATGLREGDLRFVRSGILAVGFATDRARNHHRRGAFEQFAVAAAYNLARRRLADDPLFRRMRGGWERWLRRARTVWLHRVERYGNHSLVDAVAVIELQRTGLRSSGPRAVLGGAAARSRQLAKDLINVRVPRLLPPRGPAVLSDPPDNPLAYHQLSLAFYARAVDLLGRGASPAARRVLRRGLRATAVIMAPNGSVSYFGRSQDMSGSRPPLPMPRCLRAGSAARREPWRGWATRSRTALSSGSSAPTRSAPAGRRSCPRSAGH